MLKSTFNKVLLIEMGKKYRCENHYHHLTGEDKINSIEPSRFKEYSKITPDLPPNQWEETAVSFIVLSDIHLLVMG